MRALVVALLLACGGRPAPGSVKIGVPRYDDYFREVNAVLHEAGRASAGEQAGAVDERGAAYVRGAGGAPGALRESARRLGADALALLEAVERDVPAPKRERVRQALREAAERLAGVQ